MSYITNGVVLSKVHSTDDFKNRSAQRKATLDNALRIYDRLPNSTNTLQSNVGIVVGRVQSGKTANAITLSALAFDNSHRFIIVFLSNNSVLFNQNAKRFHDTFEGINDVIVTDQSKDGDFDSNFDVQTLDYLYNQGKKLLVCCLKNSNRINGVINRVSKSGYGKDYSIIIDDEADEASMATGSEKKKFAEDPITHKLLEQNRTATNKALVALKNKLSKVGYISLTATPEANILLQDFQELAPDYCVTTEPGSDYTGLSTFHDSSSIYVKGINDYNVLLQPTGIPASLEEAIYIFIAGCIIRKTRGDVNSKHSMMVHPDKKIINQDTVYSKIVGYINQVKYNVLQNNTSGKTFVSEVKKEFLKIAPRTQFDEKEVNNVLLGLKLHLINGESDAKDLKNAMKLLPYHIVVGGDMLNRGLTIDGLAVSYILRVAKSPQMDTMLQRARWFGYKKQYLDTCMVYMPTVLKNQYEDLIESEEAVWEFLYDCNDNNLIPKAMVPHLPAPVGGKLTAPQKAAVTLTNYASTCVNQSIIPLNPTWNADNIKLVKSLDWSKSVAWSTIDTKNNYTTAQQHQYLRLTVADFNKFISKYKFSKQKHIFDAQYFPQVLMNLNPSHVDVLYMRYSIGEKRSTDGLRIKALLQGRSDGVIPSDPNYYIGDRYIKTSNLMVQIHRVYLKNDITDVNGSLVYHKGDEIIMLAAVLPSGYIGGTVARKLTDAEIRAKL